MSFNQYLKESMMGDLHLELEEEIERLIPEFIEDSQLNAQGLASQLMDQYKVGGGHGLEELIDIEGLIDLIGMVYDRMQKGEV